MAIDRPQILLPTRALSSIFLTMDELERRTLLGMAGLAGVGALAAMAKAGPINPPAGPVTSSGRTLDEIYDRIPAVGAAAGRIPMVPSFGQITISAPGSYILTASVTRGGTCLLINADNVDIDLNGLSLTNTTTTSSTISVTAGAEDVRIHNGATFGGLRGLATGSSCHGLILERISFVRGRSAGVVIGSGSAGVRIENCRIRDTGATTTAADSGLNIFGIDASGSPGLLVRGCQITRLFNNGTSPGLFRGVTSSGIGTVVEHCQAMNETAITGTGFFLVNGLYRNNRAVNFSTGYSNGVDGGGNF
jgi:hypothetical protein